MNRNDAQFYDEVDKYVKEHNVSFVEAFRQVGANLCEAKRRKYEDDIKKIYRMYGREVR